MGKYKHQGQQGRQDGRGYKVRHYGITQRGWDIIDLIRVPPSKIIGVLQTDRYTKRIKHGFVDIGWINKTSKREVGITRWEISSHTTNRGHRHKWHINLKVKPDEI